MLGIGVNWYKNFLREFSAYSEVFLLNRLKQMEISLTAVTNMQQALCKYLGNQMTGTLQRNTIRKFSDPVLLVCRVCEWCTWELKLRVHFHIAFYLFSAPQLSIKCLPTPEIAVKSAIIFSLAIGPCIEVQLKVGKFV